MPIHNSGCRSGCNGNLGITGVPDKRVGRENVTALSLIQITGKNMVVKIYLHRLGN